MSVTKLPVDPGLVEFGDWRFTPWKILGVLRGDIDYLRKPGLF